MLEIAGSIGDIVTAAPIDAVALLGCTGAPITFGHLRGRIARISAALRAARIQRQDRVAVILPAGPELAIAFLGVTSAAVCAPLNPAYGEGEFASYFTGLNVKAAIVSPEQTKAIAALDQLSIPRVDVSGIAASLPADPARPEDVALILQTSGTTSRPKIVPLTHRNLYVSARNVAANLHLTAADRCLNVMPLFHIHGLVAGLLAPFSSGGSVVCPAGFSAAAFFSWLDQFQPTWYTAVPTMHQAILARAGANRAVIERRPLRFIRSCSAALAPSSMQDLEEAFRAPVVEAYGMTEAAHQMASNSPTRRKAGTVGFAAGTSIAVMDEQGGPLPPNATGEIVVRGENVMGGYEDAPAANETAFRYGWFHTGDRGFFDDEGFLVISGRIKEIINRGGEKISPREVDDVLLAHPAVAEAVTFAVPHRQLGEAVGAAVVAKENAVVSALELREFVAARLASFKVPEIVKFVPEIPRAATGKIQRIGLAAKLGIEIVGEESATTDYVAPRNALETSLHEIWSQILGISTIGIHDSFFARGGDSLATTILMTRVAGQTGVEPSFVRFLDHPTIAALAAQIAARAANKPASGLVPVQPDGTKAALFCVPGHDGLAVTFCNFARHLGADQPLLAFALPPLPDGDASYRLEDLAAGFVELMQRHQPQGPYRLTGYCFGGFVAYEMARQLAAKGERVDLLALIDTYNPAGGKPSPASALDSRMRRFRGRLALQRDSMAGKNAREAILYLGGRIRAFIRERRFQANGRMYRIFAYFHLRIPSALRHPRYASSLSLKRYVPGPYDGAATLLRVQDLRPGVEKMGWGGLIRGGIEILDSPYHNLGPQSEAVARVMAEQLRARLNR